MKKRLFLCTLLAGSFMWAAAQKGEWQNPEINAVNRAPMHSHYFAYESEEAAGKASRKIQATTCRSTAHGDSTGSRMPTTGRPTSGTGLQRQRLGRNSRPRCMGTPRLRRPHLCKHRICLAGTVPEQPARGSRRRQPRRFLPQRDSDTRFVERETNHGPLWLSYLKPLFVGSTAGTSGIAKTASSKPNLTSHPI